MASARDDLHEAAQVAHGRAPRRVARLYGRAMRNLHKAEKLDPGIAAGWSGAIVPERALVLAFLIDRTMAEVGSHDPAGFAYDVVRKTGLFTWRARRLWRARSRKCLGRCRAAISLLDELLDLCENEGTKFGRYMASAVDQKRIAEGVCERVESERGKKGYPAIAAFFGKDRDEAPAKRVRVSTSRPADDGACAGSGATGGSKVGRGVPAPPSSGAAGGRRPASLARDGDAGADVAAHPAVMKRVMLFGGLDAGADSVDFRSSAGTTRKMLLAYFGGASAPLWLVIGLSRFLEQRDIAQYDKQVGAARRTGRLIPLGELLAYKPGNHTEDQKLLAAECASFVAYLIGDRPTEHVLAFMAELRRNGSAVDAVTSVLGLAGPREEMLAEAQRRWLLCAESGRLWSRWLPGEARESAAESAPLLRRER